jgi:hypothetical protein
MGMGSFYKCAGQHGPAQGREWEVTAQRGLQHAADRAHTRGRAAAASSRGANAGSFVHTPVSSGELDEVPKPKDAT